jgi:hypothetical protein
MSIDFPVEGRWANLMLWGLEIHYPFTPGQMDRFRHRLDFTLLSLNEALPWSEALIRDFAPRWDWRRLSKNPAIPWTPALIAEHEARWDWYELSENPALPWCLELIADYEERWNWWEISSNSAIPFSEELLARFVDRWNFEHLLNNPSVHWSRSTADLFLTRHNGTCEICSLDEFQWDIDLITRFTHRWYWRGLPFGKGIWRDIVEPNTDIAMEILANVPTVPEGEFVDLKDVDYAIPERLDCRKPRPSVYDAP